MAELKLRVGDRVKYAANDLRSGRHSRWDTTTGSRAGGDVAIPHGALGWVIQEFSAGAIVRWDHDPDPSCVNSTYLLFIHGAVPDLTNPEEVEAWLTS